MPTEERVLCFKRQILEELGVFQGLSLDVEKYLPVVTSPSQILYLNRSEAEQDKRYKQLIPYVLILCHDRILRYRRGKGGQETPSMSSANKQRRAVCPWFSWNTPKANTRSIFAMTTKLPAKSFNAH